MKRLSIFLLLCTAACASSGLSFKQTTVTSLNASVTALTSAQTIERSLCFNNPATEAGTHCTNPAAALVKLTDASHVAMAKFFDDAFGAAQKAQLALQLWTAGQPPPSTVSQYLTDANGILAAVKVLDPSAANLVTQAQAAVTSGAAVASAVGAK
jgi:hypothetical protein